MSTSRSCSARAIHLHIRKARRNNESKDEELRCQAEIVIGELDCVSRLLVGRLCRLLDRLARSQLLILAILAQGLDRLGCASISCTYVSRLLTRLDITST